MEVTLPQISVGPSDPAPAAGAGRAPSMSMGGMSAPNPLASHLSGLEQQYKLPQGYLAQIRAVESSNGKNLANPNSSARGPYQFINSTAERMGLSMEDRMDEFKSAQAVAKMAAGDAAAFQAKMGRAPTGADIYGMHQQGQAGYLGLLNGRTPGGAAQSLNGAGGMDAQGQLGVIQRMYNNAKPDLPGDPTTRFGAGFGQNATTANDVNAPSPGAQGPTNQGPTAATPTTPAAAPAKFDGGVMGLLQGSDYTGAGAGKDFSGKMADFTGSSAFTSGMKGLMGALGGGQSAPAIRAPGIQNLSPEDEANTPNMSLLQMLYAKGGRQGAAGGR